MTTRMRYQEGSSRLDEGINPVSDVSASKSMERLISAIKIKEAHEPSKDDGYGQVKEEKMQPVPSVTSIMTTQSIPEPWHYRREASPADHYTAMGPASKQDQSKR